MHVYMNVYEWGTLYFYGLYVSCLDLYMCLYVCIICVYMCMCFQLHKCVPQVYVRVCLQVGMVSIWWISCLYFLLKFFP